MKETGRYHRCHHDADRRARAGSRFSRRAASAAYTAAPAETFDISADLEELASTPVAVVCAGAKSILDIGKTLEVLESGGVPVLGYRTDDFPAFFARDSGHPVDHRFDTAGEIAAVILTAAGARHARGPARRQSDPGGGCARCRGHRSAHRGCHRGSRAQGVTRKALTPYLLQRLFELTGGRSLQANIALVKNNAALAAAIAVALAEAGDTAPPDDASGGTQRRPRAGRR